MRKGLKMAHESFNSKRKFQLLSLSDLKNLPDTEWFIEGILPMNSFAQIYGEPGCGKTFLALSMCHSISTASNWLDPSF